MGIRFRCPNGHKLNVKSFLAGKKAFCPVCGTNLVVPFQSTGEADQGSKSARRKTGADGKRAPKPAPAAVQQPPMAVPAVPVAAPVAPVARAMPIAEPLVWMAPAAPMVGAGRVVEPLPLASMPPPTPGGQPDVLTEAPDAVWYVRPPSGGQYGPATSSVMRGWVQEGRVSADSLVWREGWRDWQDAGNVFPQLHQGAELRAFQKAVPPGAAAPRTIQPRRRSSAAQAIIITILILAVFVLAGVFAWVVINEPAQTPGEPASKSKPVAPAA